MSPIKRNDIYYLYVPRQRGGVVLRTTGTTEKRIYTLMKAMVQRLKAERRWALLNAVTSKPAKLTLGQIFDADRTKTLDALDASLSAQRLDSHTWRYLNACEARGLAPRNIENINRQLHSFVQEGMTTADLTTANVTAWLASLKTSPGTRRQYLYAVTGFTRYLVDVGVLADYPLSRVKAPKKNPARMTYMDAATDERIVQAASPKYRALFAFIKGTGCDVTTALNTIARDIEIDRGVARLHGTKTAQRDVHEALVEGWAWKYVLPAIRSVLPFAQPWAHLTRHGASKHHRACCKALGITDYTLKDARHSVAVRMAKANYTMQEIAGQLGNSVALVASVYARYVPVLEHKSPAHVTIPVTEATGA